MGSMKGITVKLPEATVRQLRGEAKASGRSVGAIIRERIEAPNKSAKTVYELIPDLIGSVSGPGISATNDRIKFRRHRD